MNDTTSAELLTILEPAATRVRDPLSGKSIWMQKMLHSYELVEDELRISLSHSPSHLPEQIDKIKQALSSQLKNNGWKGPIKIESKEEAKKVPPPPKKDPVKGMSGPGMAPHGGPIKKMPLPGVKNIIAVASGKGGVGKSTLSVNVAVALKKLGLNVGLLDADVYGPSLPTMMRVSGQPLANDKKQILPKEAYGIRCISMGFMVNDEEPIIWRGPMVMGVVKQFFQQVAWGELDYLIVDLPPGTGDAQLTMIQSVPIDGALIITTPQKVAVMDAVRGVEMFQKLGVPILGIVENMSYLEIPGGDKMFPFGQGGGQSTADRYKVPLLEKIPIDERIRAGGDVGMPVALSTEEISEPFLRIAMHISKDTP